MGNDTSTPSYISGTELDRLIMTGEGIPTLTVRCLVCNVLGLWDEWDNNHKYGKRCPCCQSDNTEDVGGLA